jgi:transcriptional regulator with XRE-family HTH domain
MQVFDKAGIIERLKAWRMENKLSTRKFAMDAGIDQAHYAKVEGGKMFITESMLVKFFERYGGLNRDFILYGKVNTAINSIVTAAATSEMSALNASEDVLTIADNIIKLAPQVEAKMEAAEMRLGFTARENKIMLAYTLLKQTVMELRQEVARLKNKG